MPDTLHDGSYLEPVTNGPRRYEYPFRMNGDKISSLFEQEFWQAAATFHPAEFAVAHPTEPGFYLVKESEPVEFMAGLLKFTRMYSRVPTQQIVPGSMYVTKPALSGTFPAVIGGSRVIQPDASVAVFKFYDKNDVVSETGAPNGNPTTGGTYTVTVGASTTGAVAYNASAGTLQTALNALGIVSGRGNFVVTGTYTTAFTLTLNAAPTPTIDASSITLSAGSKYTTVSSLSAIGAPWFQFQISGSTVLTGGTFTLTIFGQTTGAIAYNASAATVAAAINALSNVNGTATVAIQTAGYTASGNILLTTGSIWFQVFISLPTISGAAGSLTPSGSSISFAASGALGGSLQLSGGPITSRTIYAPGHGISNTDSIYINSGGEFFTLEPGEFNVVDADNLLLTQADSGAVFSSAGSITEVGKLTSTYTGGTVLTRIKRVTDYYLPGISPGIATIDDIPLPAYQGDADTLLAAIMDGSTSINYEVGDLSQWRDTPILARTVITLNAATL
jgi:hypothetical protein